jgi:purine-cytosine permease-like protein
MNQINVVAAGIFGAIATAFAYMFDFYPIMVGLGMVGLTAYVALVPAGGSKKAPPSEPWYMK